MHVPRLVPSLATRMARRALGPVLALGLLLAVSAPAGAAQWQGINDLSSVSGVIPFATAATLASEAGVNSTRLIVDWSWIEPSKGSYAWGIIDGVYWADLALGIKPLIGVTGAPRWAWDPSATCPTSFCAFPPGIKHDPDYKDMMQRLAARYPQAAGIEVGNEPNLAWAWAGGIDPARYTDLVKVAYAAVKGVNRNMPVIAGALAPVLSDDTSSTSYGLRPFINAMYANGLKGHADGISIHPYPQATDFSKSFKAVDLTEETEAANGATFPLWATELGMTTTGDQAFSLADQATTVPTLVASLRSDPSVRGVYVHTLLDAPSNPVASERGYGLIGADLVPKPAFCALAAIDNSSWSCPSTVLTVTPTATQSGRWDAQTLLQAAAEAAIRFHAAHGSYLTLTSSDLHALDARLSALPGQGSLAPGATADPSRIGVYPGTSGADWLVLCNTSQADRSYCISTVWRGAWAFGNATGPINTAATATIYGSSTSW